MRFRIRESFRLSDFAAEGVEIPDALDVRAFYQAGDEISGLSTPEAMALMKLASEKLEPLDEQADSAVKATHRIELRGSIGASGRSTFG